MDVMQLVAIGAVFLAAVVAFFVVVRAIAARMPSARHVDRTWMSGMESTMIDTGSSSPLEHVHHGVGHHHHSAPSCDAGHTHHSFDFGAGHCGGGHHHH